MVGNDYEAARKKPDAAYSIMPSTDNCCGVLPLVPVQEHRPSSETWAQGPEAAEQSVRQ